MLSEGRRAIQWTLNNYLSPADAVDDLMMRTYLGAVALTKALR
jgi:hypothetical protein